MGVEENIRFCDDGIVLKIRISPNASKNQIMLSDDMIKVKVTAQPIENKANKALVGFLSKYLKVPKTSISIVKGETSKDKTLHISVSDEKKRDEIRMKFLDK